MENLIIVSDIHCGCRLGLCPATGADLDDGGHYDPSNLQRHVYNIWRDFWDNWVPDVTNHEPFTVVFNGDAIDGVHHNSTTQITNNLTDQSAIAYELLAPIVELCEGRYYHIRGTEAHVGKSAQEEERLARDLNAIPNNIGQYARYELWKYLNDEQVLVHLLHHIGTTGSAAYESTAVLKELVESFTEAGRWGRRPPDIIVRSHRHRNFEVSMPGINHRARAIVTPAWQGKTPFTWKIPGARISEPHFGGCLIRVNEEGRWYADHYVKSLEREEPE